jgi:hypothetical protein
LSSIYEAVQCSDFGHEFRRNKLVFGKLLVFELLREAIVIFLPSLHRFSRRTFVVSLGHAVLIFHIKGTKEAPKACHPEPPSIDRD